MHHKISDIPIPDAIERLTRKLVKAFDTNRSAWCGKQWMNASLTAEYLLLCKYLDLDDDERVGKAIRHLELNQNPDGGYAAYFGGSSEVSLSSICNLALNLYAGQVDDQVLKKSNRFYELNRGKKRILLIARFYRFLFDNRSMKGLPQVRPELIIWPKGSGVSIYDVASWVRSWLVPVSLLWHLERYDRSAGRFPFYIPWLRKRSIRKAKNWLLAHQESDGSWYGVFSSTMISLMALYKLGYPVEHERIQKGLSFIHSLQDSSQDTLRQMAFLGPVWDTAHALLALQDDPVVQPELIRQAQDFLLKKQVTGQGDWSINNRTEPGGWPFQFINRWYPDVDDTTMVLRSIKALREEPGFAQAIDRGIRWLWSMQNRDGSWGAFDRNNNKFLPEWYLNFRRYYIGDGPSLMVDRGTPDLTAHALESLASYGFKKGDARIDKAIRWLKSTQNSDGSWFGRWGLVYLYGTSQVLTALGALGEEMNQIYIQRAAKFLLCAQNEDGGFGESPEAYFDPVKKAKGPSEPSQTAWVVMGLIATGHQESETVEKAIQYLVKKLKPDGSYDTALFQAVAAPPLYQRYELYPVYFPLMALRQFQHGVQSW